MSTTHKATKRGPGRPKGSPNRETEGTREIPARCKRCQSTDMSSIAIVGQQRFSGVAPDGMPYNLIIRRRKVCKSCGQMHIVTQYLMVADSGTTNAEG